MPSLVPTVIRPSDGGVAVGWQSLDSDGEASRSSTYRIGGCSVLVSTNSTASSYHSEYVLDESLISVETIESNSNVVNSHR